MNMFDRIKKLFFYRQHPDAALRYWPIVRLLKKEKLINSKILEVGSGSYGVTPYLKKPVVGVDIAFSEPKFYLLQQIHGLAINLPFSKKQFDVVILSDVLEHLPLKERGKAVSEAIRVAKRVVLISGPFGEKAAKQDKELADLSIKKTGQMHPYFKDHLKYGLPEIYDIERYLNNNHRVKRITIIGQYLNLSIRKWLMIFFITKNKLIYYFYLKGLMLLVPLLKHLNKKPCYRTLILIKLIK